MLEVHLESGLGARLRLRAEQAGKSTDEYVNEAVRQHLEDREDYDLAVVRDARDEKTYSLEEIERELELDT